MKPSHHDVLCLDTWKPQHSNIHHGMMSGNQRKVSLFWLEMTRWSSYYISKNPKITASVLSVCFALCQHQIKIFWLQSSQLIHTNVEILKDQALHIELFLGFRLTIFQHHSMTYDDLQILISRYERLYV